MDTSTNTTVSVKIPFFTPQWWYENFGLELDENYWHDAEYYSTKTVEMEKLLYKKFGDIGMGSPDAPFVPRVVGCSLTTIPAIFGSRVRIPQGGFPYAEPIDLRDDEVQSLQVPEDIGSVYPIREILRQAEHLKAKYGEVEVGINWQGPLNIAAKMRGEELFVDFYEKPQLAHKVLDVATRTIIKVVRFLEDRYDTPKPDATPQRFSFGREGIGGGCYQVCDCNVMMISNKFYRQFVLPCDQLLAREFKNFAIHHCGIMDPYLESYYRIDNVRRIEAGWGSDIRKVRRWFPNVWLVARLSPVKMEQVSEKEIEKDVREIIEAGKPIDRLSVETVAVGPEVTDSKIRSMFRAAKKYGKLP